MERVLKTHNTALYWHDDDKTIFVVDVFDFWTWDEALEIVTFADKTIQQQPHDVVIIYHFSTKAGATIPGSNILKNFRALADVVTPNVIKIYYVSEYSVALGIIESFMGILNNLIPIVQIDQLNFRKRLNEALLEIEYHAQSS